MISGLTLKNFTVFAKAELQFAEGLNVIAGENGTGKSHILKVAYSIAYVMARGTRDSRSPAPYRGYVYNEISKKLYEVFRLRNTEDLIRQHRIAKASVEMSFDKGKENIAFSFKRFGRYIIDESADLPIDWCEKRPVFVPTRELLTIYPGFVSLYETTTLPFDETWRDTCILLGAPSLKGERILQVKGMLSLLEGELGGVVEFEDDHFFLVTGKSFVESNLMAEGHRKLAMLLQLISNGSLIEGSSLFWDEPEANLNPKIIKQVARTILQLCQYGVQVFVATHSLFLMRELEILLKDPQFSSTTTRFIGLHPKKSGVKVQQGATFYDMGEIVSLHEELTQSDRFMRSERL